MEEDQRFAHIKTDPKFRRIPKSERKVKIDKRFKSMFKEKQFKLKYTIDKRGRPVNHTSNEDLKRYYELSSDEEQDSGVSDNETDTQGKYVQAPKSSASENEESESDQLNVKLKNDKAIPKNVKKKLQDLNIDYARGEGALLSESSSDDEEETESEEEKEEENLVHAWGELDRDAERTENATNRLAACNMDWDRIKAADLMVLLSSFLPLGGLIQSITIYPSEFGLQRMKEEEISGPTELVKPKEDDDNNGNEGSKYHMEKLRQYQLNRLKYYYAVIVCDNKNTANKIYTECDGMEYESSATKVDLRFIPDDMEFDQEPKEVCEKLPEPGKYQPRFFTTTALQQAKVDLTWDETNPERIELTQKLSSGNVDDIANEDLQTYLASSSGEEEDEDVKAMVTSDNESEDDKNDKTNPIDKYKALLQDIENEEKEKKNKDVEMEVTWGIDLKEKTEKLVKKKLSEKEEKTPFQQYLDKRKEKRKAKREQHKSRNMSESDSDIPSDIDMNDPYFAEEFTKPEFKRKAVKKLSQRTLVDSTENSSKQAELELLLLNSDDQKKHFSLENIQARDNDKKSKRKFKNKKNIDEEIDKEDDFKIDVTDARFLALYSSHHFNIDPTDSHYKKTKNMEAIVNEKLKRRTETTGTAESTELNSNTTKKNAELNVLVKSVKRKTEALNNVKRKKRSGIK